MINHYKVYWQSPGKGAVPRESLKVRGAYGAKLLAQGRKLSDEVIVYEVPDTEDNRIITSAYGDDFSYENPIGKKPTKVKAQSIKEEAPPVVEPSRPTRRLTKIEVMDRLSKAGIRYRTNEKPETLFGKLPDDIKRNFELDKQEL